MSDKGVRFVDKSGNGNGVNITGSTKDHASKGSFSVTPSDSTEFAQPARSLYVGGAGNVAVETVEGESVSFVGVQAGTVLPVQCRKVKSTGTTATSIVGMF